MGTVRKYRRTERKEDVSLYKKIIMNSFRNKKEHKNTMKPGMVVHTCNPHARGDEDFKFMFQPSLGN